MKASGKRGNAAIQTYDEQSLSTTDGSLDEDRPALRASSDDGDSDSECVDGQLLDALCSEAVIKHPTRRDLVIVNYRCTQHALVRCQADPAHRTSLGLPTAADRLFVRPLGRFGDVVFAEAVDRNDPSVVYASHGVKVPAWNEFTPTARGVSRQWQYDRMLGQLPAAAARQLLNEFFDARYNPLVRH